MEEITFKQAMERLKEIEFELSKDEIIEVEKMSELQKEAEKLHKIALSKLNNIEK